MDVQNWLLVFVKNPEVDYLEFGDVNSANWIFCVFFAPNFDHWVLHYVVLWIFLSWYLGRNNLLVGLRVKNHNRFVFFIFLLYLRSMLLLGSLDSLFSSFFDPVMACVRVNFLLHPVIFDHKVVVVVPSLFIELKVFHSGQLVRLWAVLSRSHSASALLGRDFDLRRVFKRLSHVDFDLERWQLSDSFPLSEVEFLELEPVWSSELEMLAQLFVS